MSGAASGEALRLTCPECGRDFACDPAGDCWCKALPPLRPVPREGNARCLCPCQLKPEAEPSR